MSARSLALLEDAARKAPSTTVEAAARTLEAGTSPIRAAFAARALNALAQLVAGVNEEALGNATGAPSDFDVLVRVLEKPEALAVLQHTDPLAEARLRGLRHQQLLLEKAGGALSADQVAALLKISRQAVDKRRKAGRLIGLSTGRHGYLYPACQFTPEGGTVAGLEEVLADLREFSPWMQLAYLMNANTSLDESTPLEEMRKGNIDKVRRAALSYGEQGGD